jgi:hypothetical protein
MPPKIENSALKAAILTEAILGEVQQGVQHAFEVIRDHTSHTQGYVAIALKFIEQYGCSEDKERLNDLIMSLQQPKAKTRKS